VKEFLSLYVLNSNIKQNKKSLNMSTAWCTSWCILSISTVLKKECKWRGLRNA
jgi:hypothetical protein